MTTAKQREGSHDNNMILLPWLLYHLIKYFLFVLSIQLVQLLSRSPLDRLSLRSGRGSLPAYPLTGHHMSKTDDHVLHQLCVPIATRRIITRLPNNWYNENHNDRLMINLY